jgi:hypothetical protein
VIQLIRLLTGLTSTGIRRPQYDDQMLFWILIREIHDPEIVPVGECMSAKYNVADFKENQLPTCFLDSCMFSAGMVSDFMKRSGPSELYRTLLRPQ